jgi:hypothetical protein
MVKNYFHFHHDNFPGDCKLIPHILLNNAVRLGHAIER